MIEWKWLTNAGSDVEVSISLVNHHVLRRIGTLSANDVAGRTARRLIQDIGETPPRTEVNEAKRPIVFLSSDELRKRSKTANAVSSLMRQALYLAWEEGLRSQYYRAEFNIYVMVCAKTGICSQEI
ncbi:hypothetical protein E5163_03185 [Marinicauda algicola]|uniref:Uncharacterized protein n=2 Tax=Marinicauda algicola TaxID=2029849 RepID=A0A4S2H3F1_9PROT|nr:hypothetical protein E5163_03185 [Marinicauda algicola]